MSSFIFICKGKVMSEGLDAPIKKKTIANALPKELQTENPIPKLGSDEVSVVNIPLEQIELPSKGLLYPVGSELAKGVVSMKYMTAREEDILTNENFIKQGIVLDKLFESLIKSPIRYEDLLVGDRNAIMIAARILSYGPTYSITVKTRSGNDQEEAVNLENLQAKEIDETLITVGENTFSYKLPKGGNVLTFKLLTIKDERAIDERVKMWKKHKKSGNLTARLREMILAVDGEVNKGKISTWIDDQFLVADTREFRKYVNSIQPNLDFELELTDEETGDSFRKEFTPGLDFFWPDAKL